MGTVTDDPPSWRARLLGRARSHLPGRNNHTTGRGHLIGTDTAFFADGLTSLKGNSPPGVTSQRSDQRQPAPQLNDEEKVRSAASVAVHQQYGYELPPEQERSLIDQVAQVINADPAMRARVIASMNQLLSR